jgi:putative endonuclease
LFGVSYLQTKLCEKEMNGSSFLILVNRRFFKTWALLKNMKPTGTHNYFIYITTNKNKTVLYTGVTNDVAVRLSQHLQSSQKFPSSSFAGKYNAVYLLYYERFGDINHAIEREKEIKGWRRSKKEALISSVNPGWRFLNDEVE